MCYIYMAHSIDKTKIKIYVDFKESVRGIPAMCTGHIICIYIFEHRQLDPDDIVQTPTLKTLYIFNEAIKTLQEFE